MDDLERRKKSELSRKFVTPFLQPVLNPYGYCFVVKVPKQKLIKLNAVEIRKEPWKSRRWMEQFQRNKELRLNIPDKCRVARDLCRDACWVVCCPPCSANGITNKLAFSAPRKPTYWPLVPPEDICSPNNPCSVSTRDFTGGVKVFWITTKKGHRIACTYVDFGISTAPVILYNHSNADDLGSCVRHVRHMSKLLYCHVLAYDYSGYGQSEGFPSLTNLYADAEAAYLALRFFYRFNPEEIILYGASLGSVAAAYLAAKYNCKGVIMMAAVPSGIRLLCRNSMPQRESFPFDVLDNVSLAKKIRIPVLVVHGEEDDLCSIEGAKHLVKRLPFAAKPAFYKDVSHNEVELLRFGSLRMSYFIHVEVDYIWSSIYESNKVSKV